ncbi:MAG: fibrillarin-like rRNA/tRNA 2'-O-methyltransferase [Candidatus Micrarchaeota archaeon]|nr:fibrillarin-like rRNA/tRNA 2'-O-methyltransferase [Candidatus Micrarchaeota archaeon]
MEVEKVFDGVFKIDSRLCTVNLVKGSSVYGEDLINYRGREYRLWNPYRSKLAAAILLGLNGLAIKEGSTVLYLGAATGTTSSHVSDIVGSKGMVYCVEISERNMRELFKVCDVRHNMLPIYKDARDVPSYSADVGTVDAIYQDVAARDQDDILLRNSALLKMSGHAYVAIKSQSIDVSMDPKEVYKNFFDKVGAVFDVIESIDIGRYDKKHLFVTLKKTRKG